MFSNQLKTLRNVGLYYGGTVVSTVALKIEGRVPFSSVGRAGVPCKEALSSLQRTQVRVLAWGQSLRVTSPLSHPVSCFPSSSCCINKKAITEFACSACACVGFLQVFRFTPPSKHAHYIDSVSTLVQGEIWSWSLDAIVAHCSLGMG